MQKNGCTTLYIARNGNDKWNGDRAEPARNSKNGPLASLAGARNRLRELRRKGELIEPATVYIRDGRYELSEPVDFSAQDSGNITFTAYPNEQPIFSGGRHIKDWKEAEINGCQVWVADLPEVRAGKWYFRQLWVNGERRKRPRYPKWDEAPDQLENVLTLEVPEIDHTQHILFSGSTHALRPRREDMKKWNSLHDAELVMLHFWVDERMPDLRYDEETGLLHSSRRCIFTPVEAHDESPARYYIENLFEELNSPGEWYLHRDKGKLYYIPKPGETFKNTEIHVPRLHQLIRVHGEHYGLSKEGGDIYGVQTVQGLRFQGLTFEYADWYQPEGEHLAHDQITSYSAHALAISPQAAEQVPGTLSFRIAQNCAIQDCTLRHMGLYAVQAGQGCRSLRFIGNHIHDIGAGGIRVGGSELDGPPWGRTGQITISDNHIHTVGRVFHCGIGVLLTHAFEIKVRHNHIHDLFYSGVSLGWAWSYRETVSRDNLIENNRIHDIGKGFLSDLAAVYSLGVQPGTVFRGNHVYNVNVRNYGGWGLYMDEGSSHMIIENNLVHDIQQQAINLHFGRENIVRNNILAFSYGGLISIGKNEGHNTLNIYRNILYTPDAKLYSSGYNFTFKEALPFESDANIIFSPTGKSLYIGSKRDPNATLSLKQLQKEGRELRSIEADPKFKDPGKRDFSLPKNSPAWDIGFRPVDWSKCGPRPKTKRD